MSTCIIKLDQCSDCLKMHRESQLCRLEDEPTRNLCVLCYEIWRWMNKWSKGNENPKRI
jgi:hypothetical protein